MSDSFEIDVSETGETTATGGNAPQTPYVVSDVLGSEETKKAILEYVCSEIVDVRDGSDRAGLLQRWERWRRIRRARPESDTRESPWENAANTMPPLTAQKVNTIYAKEVAAFATKKPPVEVVPMSMDDSEKARSLEKFFKGLSELRNGLNMPKNIQRIFYEQVSMGTHFVKVPFLIDQWAFKRTDEMGTEQVTYKRHQGPSCVSVRLEDFFTRPYWKDLQRAPWVAVRYKYFQHELKQQAAMGAFDPKELEKVFSVPLTEYDENTLSSLSGAGIDSGTIGKSDPNKEYEIYEVYVFWDADGDGIPEDIKLWVEPDTQTLLRSEFNKLSIRDIEPVLYFEDPDLLYGVGVCEMTDSLQEEVTTLHNMRIDGTHLAMLKLWFMRRGSGLTDEEFHPMKVFELDDPSADMKVVDFMDVAPSCLQGELVAREYADKVTGASDYMAGFNDKVVGSGATVGGTMFLAQQSNSILNSILANAESSISNIYQIAFYQCVANKELLDLSFLSAEDQMNVMEVLSMAVEDIPTKFRFTVKSTDISKTDEAKKQNFLAVSQLYGVYGEKSFQLAQMMLQAPDPLMKETATKLFVGSRDFMARMIEFFEVGDPNDYLPYVEHIKLQLKAIDDVRAQQALAQKEAMRNAGGQGAAVAEGGGAVQGGLGPMPGADVSGLGGQGGLGGLPQGAEAGTF